MTSIKEVTFLPFHSNLLFQMPSKWLLSIWREVAAHESQEAKKKNGNETDLRITPKAELWVWLLSHETSWKKTEQKLPWFLTDGPKHHSPTTPHPKIPLC